MDKNTLIPIGKMAKANNVSIATLRLYDEMGLIKPSFIDPQTNYRYYDVNQTSRLDLIRYMRDMGMSIKDISLLLEKEDIDLIEEKLVERSIQIRSEIKALKSTQDAVDRTIKSIERYRKSPLPGTLSLEFIERRRILYIQSPIDFYRYGIEKYEECIRNLRLKLVGMNIPQVLSYSLGTSVKKDDFMEGKLVADKIFIFGDKRLSEYSDDTLLLESGMYACVYLDNYDNEKKEAERLLKFALDNGYEIAGDYICEEMTELNFLQKRQRNMFLRLQVPVIFSK
ncbi:MAG: helix-turn-helix domain-containing protein [Spirochaetales bacterium]|nr:helix-turn-helix domain-containing protein [Spirochaetales bacterium]